MSLRHLLENNKTWAAKVKGNDPAFFERLSQQQAPKILWIGCSDSRVPANQIVDLLPGEIFVHRNIANIVVHTDLNCLSVIEFAVEVLEVKHIIVCGHYGCGGVTAAVDDQNHGLIDNWLRGIKELAVLHKEALELLPKVARVDRLCEINVERQVTNVANTTVVQKAWDLGKPLSLHGWIYDIRHGILKEIQ